MAQHDTPPKPKYRKPARFNVDHQIARQTRKINGLLKKIDFLRDKIDEATSNRARLVASKEKLHANSASES